MPTTTAITDWGVATWTGLTAGLTAFFAFLPALLGAIVILLIGWGVASLLYTLTDKLLDAVRFDALMSRIRVDEAINRSGVRIDPSNLVATLVKWSVLLVAFMMAAEKLGLTQVSMGISSILGYIPNVIAAALILGLGLLLAGFVSNLVRGAAASAGVRTTELLADLAYWAIAIFAALGAIGQLNIAPVLVQTLYTAVIAAVALAGALAFGLGLREQARDVVAGRALADHVHEGDEIVMGDIRGRVTRVGPLKTLISGTDGTMSVPNHLLTDQSFRITGPAMAGAGGGGGAAPRFEEDVPPSAMDQNLGERSPEHPWRPDENPPIGS